MPGIRTSTMRHEVSCSWPEVRNIFSRFKGCRAKTKRLDQTCCGPPYGLIVVDDRDEALSHYDPPVDPSYLQMRKSRRKHRSRSVCCTISGYVHHFRLLARPRAHVHTLSHVRPECITRYNAFFLL